MSSVEQVRALLALDNDQTKAQFSELCAKMEAGGLKDIKFCLKGYDSLEAVQRQILAVEKMHELEMTQDIGTFELFNQAYAR